MTVAEIILTAAVLLLFVISFTAIITLLKTIKRTSGNEGTEIYTRLAGIENNLSEINTIFSTPAKRGSFGETELINILNDFIPPRHFKNQYTFSDGTRVDSALILNKKIIAIDSKFQYEKILPILKGGEMSRAALLSAVKPHIDAVSSKYIKPSEGTMNFAIMFIPSEKIYYTLFVENPFLFDAAVKQNVIPAGPYSIYLYIQTIAHGLKGLEISENAEKILKQLEESEHELNGIASTMSTAAKHLNNLTSNFNTAEKQTRNLLQKIILSRKN